MHWHRIRYHMTDSALLYFVFFLITLHLYIVLHISLILPNAGRAERF
jgi:hypothetical protein